MKLSECNTYSKQGNIGLAYAIAYYSKLGYTISVPLTDTQDYDLIVDSGNNLLKVLVKTTTSKDKNSGNYKLNLRVTGGNRSGKGKIKKFYLNKCDLVFAMTEDMLFYSIPRNEINAGACISLCEKWNIFKVSIT